MRQIVVQRPAGLQQLRPSQLIATQQLQQQQQPAPAMPRAPATVNTVQPVPAASVPNPPKKGLSLTVCDAHLQDPASFLIWYLNVILVREVFLLTMFI